MISGSDQAVLRRTNDFHEMRRLALESGLEDGNFDNFVVAYGFYVGPELVGCAGLRFKDGIHTVECLAVAGGFRNRGLGRRLVEAIESEAKTRNIRELWAVARAPGFFVSVGYSISKGETERGPKLDSCRKCRQFGVSCNPAIVVKTL